MLLKINLLKNSDLQFTRIKAFYILLFIVFSFPIQSQVNQNGIPLIKNYSPDEYRASSQNWSIVQDKRGLMYFANNFGLLQYDGANWKLFINEISSELRSLAVDDYGTIYYGGAQDFGIMMPDSIGYLEYKSIYKIFNSGEADFNLIWNIKIVGDFAFFQSNEKIFRVKLPVNLSKIEDIKNKIKVFEPEKAFHWSFNVYKKFYVREFDKGLLVLDGDKLKLVPGGEVFANERVYVMLPYENDRILICSREGGLYIFDPQATEKAIKKLDCSANDLLIESQIYGGVELPNVKYAISTLNNGVIIIDKSGNVVEHLNVKSGLPDQQITSIYADNILGNLWFASSENGIFNANIGSPFKEWNRKNGLNGVVVDIARFKDKIYVATGNGVFYLDESKSGFSGFEPIAEIPHESWDLQYFKSVNAKDDKLLVATSEGIFEIKDRKATRVINNGRVFQLLQSSINANRVFVGYENGFGSIEFNSNSKNWNFLGKNDSINRSILSIYEKPDGNIYLGTAGSGIILLKEIFDKKPMIIEKAQGLPLEGSEFKIYQIKDDIVFASQKGLFLYNEKEHKAVPYLKFGDQFSGKDIGVSSILRLEDEYWLSVYTNNITKGGSDIKYDLIKLKENGSTYLKAEGFAKIIPQKLPLAIYNDGNFIWVANEKGVYKFDKTTKKDYNKSFNISIFRVSTEVDTVFEGTFYEQRDSVKYILFKQSEQLKPELTYENNNIVFECSALFYEQEDKMEYSYRLIGSTDKWSNWTNESKKSYTNLSPRNYRFEIRARNIYGSISNINSYEFSVLPPWYMTKWARFLFFLSAVLFVWLIVKLNIRRLQLDKIKLEGIIDERTAEIRQKNVVLEQQKEEITAQRDEIEIQKDKVTLQKDQIEEQKKNITDSILYASKIQIALLPPEPVLDELLPEHFILWKPRDIVSGDFYWTTKKNHKTVLVAADCTGHGVPGAFMSMLGISYLNEIMNKFEDIRAGQILDELKASVKTALRQTGKDHETKDGMDMSLCILDFENMQMEYAGAYNSLLLIRDNEVIKYDADRMPIGIYIKERDNFKNHIIEMKKGDNFYIHSDGYVDQFGGESGNKLMTRRFKELLLQNHTKHSREQKIALEEFLTEWTSYKNEVGETYKQLDDILVIGIKI